MRQRVSGRSGKPAGRPREAWPGRLQSRSARLREPAPAEDLQRSTRPAIRAGIARAKGGTRPENITAQPEEEEEVVYPHEAVREHLARDCEERLGSFAGESLVPRVLGTKPLGLLHARKEQREEPEA